MNTSSAGYAEYLRALSELHAAPAEQKSEVRKISSGYNNAVALANNSVEEAKERYSKGQEAIERHLRNATNFLGKLEETSRIPPRIKPSIIPQTATGREVETALQQLSETTIRLGLSVDALVKANELALPPAEPPSPTPVHPSVADQSESRGRWAIVGAVIAAAVLIAIVVFVISYF